MIVFVRQRNAQVQYCWRSIDLCVQGVRVYTQTITQVKCITNTLPLSIRKLHKNSKKIIDRAYCPERKIK